MLGELRADAAEQASGDRRLRVAEHRPDLPFLDDLSGIDDGDAVGNAADHFHLVGDQHDGQAELAVDVLQERQDRARRFRVERRRRFIREQQGGAGGKGVRMECRIGGADLNPYLAFAALIAAGLAGIDEKLELPKPFVGDAYQAARLPEIPKTLRDATEALAKSKMLKEAFGEDVVEHYVHTARWEQLEYDRRITDWELYRGFERY